MEKKPMFATRLAGRLLRLSAAVLLVIMLLASSTSLAQNFQRGKAKLPAFIPAGYDDYQNMLDQLGIKKMRPGRNGRGLDTSDEATANPYKETMPDLMTCKDGTKVTTVRTSGPNSRAEIVEDFEREVFGQFPIMFPR